MLSPAPLCSLTYALGRSLYVPLTCRSNSCPLPDTRGPGFVLPADVVGSLLALRRLELAHPASGGGDGNISSGEKMHLPPLDLPYVSHIDDTVAGPIITDDMLCKDIESRFQDAKRSRKQYDSLVIAGEGEPTLRLSTLLSIVRRPIRSACFGFTMPTTVRVVTNGLGDAVPGSNNNECAKQMKEAGVSGVSVALMTASSDQYDKLMHPCLPEEISTPALDVVCEFIGSCIDIGLDVEVTGVDREEVDKEAAEELARSLGVVEPVRWRPYFP